ncbi:MAG TPA: flippase [Bacteroidales bacterium]|nr:flippase [Bacteroidales bacterium]
MNKRVNNFVVNNKVILENFSFLSILQVSNLLIFILLIPFLFRILGKENYGIVIFAQTIVAYFSILVNFGLNVSATHDISINRDNLFKRTEIISSVLIIKVFFFFVSFFVVLILISLIPSLKNNPTVYIFSMLYCLSEALFPVWYFQGIEKMKYITYINVGTRVISALIVFLIIKKPDDYFLVPLLLGSGTFAGSIIGLCIMFSIKGNKFELQSLKKIINGINYNLPLFFSNVSSQIYVNGNKLLIGSILGMPTLAFYDIAERLVNMVKVPISVIGQVLFPKVSRDSDVRFVHKIMTFATIVYVIVYVLLFISADHLVNLFTGVLNSTAISIVRILGLSIIPICAGVFYAELILIPFGFIKDYAKVRIGSLVFYFSIVAILTIKDFIGVLQLSMTVIIVELFVLLYSFHLSRKNGLLNLK